MKTILFLSFLLSIAQQKCSRNAATELPSWIRARIEAIKQQPKWNPPAEVTEYCFKGKRVFLFSCNCSDQYNEVVDEQCTYICAPSGGMTGKGDRRCTDFSETAQMVKLVWKDERE